MAKNDEKESGEGIHIAILTFAMTGAGFLLFTLILVLWLNPNAEARNESLANEYKELTKKLLSPEAKSLRAQAKLSQGQENKKSISEIVNDSLNSFQISYSNFPPAKTEDLRAGLQKATLKIDLKPAQLSSILKFVAAVRDAKKGIQVEALKINRGQRTSDDSWTANVEFVDYVAK